MPCPLTEVEFIDYDVYNILANLDASKVVGIDGIGPRVLKKCALPLYYPLHVLFTKCFDQCEWTVHIVIPVHKSGDKNLVNNYRPFHCSVTHPGKTYIWQNNSKSISLVQFGTLKGRSTLQQLLVFLDFIYSNSSKQVDIIYLDIKKAFDSIPHNKLLNKLYRCGKLWKWFKSYPTDRTQHFRINHSLSTPLPVLSGVPQRSILGPYCLLYIWMIYHHILLSVNPYYLLTTQKFIMLLPILKILPPSREI